MICVVNSLKFDWLYSLSRSLSLSFFQCFFFLYFFHKTASFVGIPLSCLICLFSAYTSKQLIFPAIFRSMLCVIDLFLLSRALLAVHFHMAHKCFFFFSLSPDRIKITVIEFQHIPIFGCAGNFRSLVFSFFFIRFQ